MEVLLLGVRGMLAATRDIPVEGLMQGNAMQSITFMAAFVVVILSSLGFILMGKDRSDADNRYFAAHDALTGLVNRRSLIMALERDVARAVRLREPYAVMLVDIDHFKFVNDSHGHLAGDSVLRHVADLLRTRLRAQDPVGRYGGEEFMVLLPHTPLGGALELAETLRRAVERLPCVGGGKEIPATVSIGVCGGPLQPADGWDRLVQGGRRGAVCSQARRAQPGGVHGAGGTAPRARTGGGLIGRRADRRRRAAGVGVSCAFCAPIEVPP